MSVVPHALHVMSLHQLLVSDGTTVRRVEAFACPSCARSIMPVLYDRVPWIPCWHCGIRWRLDVHPADKHRLVDSYGVRFRPK